MEINEILLEAIKRRASDIHITPGRPVSFRIDGTLSSYNDVMLLPEDTNKLVRPLIDDDRMKELEYEGETDFAYAIAGYARFRINVFKQRGTFAMVARILPFKIPMPEDLGLPKSVVELTAKKRGLVLVTGATGSGKSTTLASLINLINQQYSRHVITLEDPIEYVHKHNKCIVNQREIGVDSRTYAGALRATLRQDPNVILVGEMRDLETISTAITAAETGHLVFSTLHTNSAASTVDRVIDVFPPYQQQQIRIQLASVLEGVISQQLIPLHQDEGRIAAYEIMIVNSAIRNLIREGKTHQLPSVIQTNRKSGMRLMDDSLVELYMNNQITGEDALNFAQDPVAMESKIII